jgi:hypothetical protein
MTQYPVLEMPAAHTHEGDGTVEGCPACFPGGVIPMGYTDRLMQDVTGTKGEPVPVGALPTERLTFRVARYLQDYPRKELTLKEIAAATGLTRIQVSSVTQRFVDERTDVARPRRGVIIYTPGRGPGIKRHKSAETSHIPPSPPPTELVVDAMPQSRPNGVYTAIPGLRTADGRGVVQDQDGVIYSIKELS